MIYLVKKWLLLLALLQMPVAMGASGEQLLNSFIMDVKTLKGDFTQLLINENAEVLQESSGTFKLQRPGKFRWDYTKPYSQVIVADGSKVWFYDVDLEQVTVKEQQAALGSTPALLLTTNKSVKDNFYITSKKDLAGLEWVELIPKDTESNFQSIRIAFTNGVLKQMELVDGFGQKTHLQFTALVTNSRLGSKAFSFEPPEGVDVIGE